VEDNETGDKKDYEFQQAETVDENTELDPDSGT